MPFPRGTAGPRRRHRDGPTEPRRPGVPPAGGLRGCAREIARGKLGTAKGAVLLEPVEDRQQSLLPTQHLLRVGTRDDDELADIRHPETGPERLIEIPRGLRDRAQGSPEIVLPFRRLIARAATDRMRTARARGPSAVHAGPRLKGRAAFPAGTGARSAATISGGRIHLVASAPADQPDCREDAELSKAWEAGKDHAGEAEHAGRDGEHEGAVDPPERAAGAASPCLRWPMRSVG